MGTVSKAMSLLTFFTPDRQSIGLSDLARLTKINKATTYRLLEELNAFGLVEQDRAAKTYRLGPEILRLATLREAAVPMSAVVRGALKALCDTTDETAHMSIMRDDRLITFAHGYSSHFATRVMMEDGEVLPFHATGSGLAILAFSTPEFVDRILGRRLTGHTSLTVTDPQVLGTILAEIQRTGTAVSVGGFEADVHSFATPVFNAHGQPLGAIAVAMPVSRMAGTVGAEISRAVHRRAVKVTRALGGLEPPDFPDIEQ